MVLALSGTPDKALQQGTDCRRHVKHLSRTLSSQTWWHEQLIKQMLVLWVQHCGKASTAKGSHRPEEVDSTQPHLLHAICRLHEGHMEPDSLTVTSLSHTYQKGSY